MKRTVGFTDFFGMMRQLNVHHLHAFFAEWLFLGLAALGGFAVQKLQVSIVATMQSLNLGSLAADSAAALANATAVRNSTYQIIGLLAVFAVYLFLAWTFTRALIWKSLLKKQGKQKLPEKYSLVHCWLKLIAVSLVWVPLTLVPLFSALLYLANLYNAPLFSLASRASGYTYIFFLQALVLALVMLYCHFTTLFYIHFFRTPKFRAVWDALKTGVTEFSRFAKPLGILLIFFVIVMLVGSLASLLPEPLKTLGAFAFLFIFSTINRAWYLSFS
ncbi:MAG: hypothetical protein Q7R76_01140 [Candidatus Woesearchaeota archaeon]|nr:hypothetical protein [Candidatus Woesearchaeota archaeon]